MRGLFTCAAAFAVLFAVGAPLALAAPSPLPSPLPQGAFRATPAFAQQAAGWPLQGWTLTAAGQAAALGGTVRPDVVVQRPEGTYTFTVLATSASLPAVTPSPAVDPLAGAQPTDTAVTPSRTLASASCRQQPGRARHLAGIDYGFYICTFGTPAYVIWDSGRGLGEIGWYWARWTDGKQGHTPVYGTCGATLCRVSAGFVPASNVEVTEVDVQNAIYAFIRTTGCGYP